MNPKNKKMNSTLMVCGALLVGTILGGVCVKISYAKYDNPYIQKIVNMFYTMKDEWLYKSDYDNLDEYLSDLAIAGLNSNKDPYTFYTSSIEEQGLGIVTKGAGFAHTYYGGNRIISMVYDKCPAKEAGLEVGDVIVGVYDSSTNELVKFKDLSIGESTTLITSNDDDTISLEIESKGKVNITKANYTQYATQYNVFKNSKEEVVVDMKINNFLDRYLVSDVKEDLDKVLEKYGTIDRLSIDLRNNGGGYVDLAIDLSSLFVPKNSTIMSVKLANGQKRTYKNNVNPIYDNIKKINLIQNEGTASASELFILALKDNLPESQVDVLGSTSYGKGIMQNVKTNKDGSVLRYTFAETYSPKGYSIHGKGIEPTVDNGNYKNMYAYYGETGFVTKDVKEKIIEQINCVLNTNYTDYNEALNAFLSSQGLSEQEFTYHIGRLLQQMAYDVYVNNEQKAYKQALEQ